MHVSLFANDVIIYLGRLERKRKKYNFNRRKTTGGDTKPIKSNKTKKNVSVFLYKHIGHTFGKLRKHIITLTVEINKSEIIY